MRKKFPNTRMFCQFAGVVFIVLAMFAGCSESVMKKSLPAPIRPEKEYTLEGRAKRMWGADNFEFGSTEQLHYIVIRGVVAPKPGQEFFGISRNMAWRRMRGQRIQIKVFDRDEQKREMADVFVLGKGPDSTDLNIGLELLKLGYGWYDGSEFELAEEYKAAEQHAREQKIGIWASENPVAPWEFDSQQQEERRELLKQKASKRKKVIAMLRSEFGWK